MSMRCVRRLVIGFVALVALMLSGCAGPWEMAPERLNVARWTVDSPEGWMHLSTPESDMLSKDGPYLEYILIQSRPLNQGFRFTKQKMNPHMLPHEAAQLITDNMRADPMIRGFRVLSSEPAMVCGRVGFKLIYNYQDPNGVELKTILYGVILPESYFNLRYTAAQRHYFDSELSTFSQVFKSLRPVSAPDSKSESDSQGHERL